jgi:hypothetical protein
MPKVNLNNSKKQTECINKIIHEAFGIYVIQVENNHQYALSTIQDVL